MKISKVLYFTGKKKSLCRHSEPQGEGVSSPNLLAPTLSDVTLYTTANSVLDVGPALGEILLNQVVAQNSFFSIATALAVLGF